VIYIGLDIGGTKLMAAAADCDGHVIETLRMPTPVDLEEGLAALDEMTGRLAAHGEVTAIGAAIGGPLNWRTGVVSPLHQPQWREVPLKARMEARWGCPFHVDVDTNIAALGESDGTDKNAGSLLYITVSTGMGGGLIVGGELFRGHGGMHPEVAHQSIHYRCAAPERIACACGTNDCLEALVSGRGIERIYGKPAERLDAGEWEEVAYNLGQGLRNAAALYSPGEIVLGGGVAIGGGEKFVAAAGKVMAAGLRIVPVPLVRLSRHGYESALMGAVAVARNAERFGFLETPR
jgi:predicted NBD/HSP70 family sugar kinase